VRSPSAIHLAPLSILDITELEPLEDATNLCYWGTEHYRNFLEQPEYFGRKAVLTLVPGMSTMAGFFLARAILENLELLKIGVYPKYQKMGIGTRLLDAAFAEGIRRGCLRCFLEVRKSNEQAIQFYYNRQFKLAGERSNYYTNPLEDALVMERWL
jgi:ribosomal-protein-alanine N-acetyltransferase